MTHDELMDRLMVGMGPPWWRPWRRRKWRRFAATVLSSPVGLAHWSASAPGQAFWLAEVVEPLAAEVAARMSEDLPDGFEVRFTAADETGNRDVG